MKALLATVLAVGVALAAAGAMAYESDGKCVVSTAQTISTTWKTICTTSIPAFSADPGNGVTVFDVDAAAITLDMTNGAGMGFEYQIVENCGGYNNDPHSIAEADLANFNGITPTFPAVGVLHPTGDPLGTAACSVSMQAKAYGGTGTITVEADQDHALSGVDDQTAFHIVAYTTN